MKPELTEFANLLPYLAYLLVLRIHRAAGTYIVDKLNILPLSPSSASSESKLEHGDHRLSVPEVMNQAGPV